MSCVADIVTKKPTIFTLLDFRKIGPENLDFPRKIKDVPEKQKVVKRGKRTDSPANCGKVVAGIRTVSVALSFGMTVRDYSNYLDNGTKWRLQIGENSFYYG